MTEKQRKPSLAETHPELAKEWHPTKNGNLTTDMVTACSRKKVWWFLPYDDPKTGKHFDFEWEATILHRADGCGCPFLVGKNVFKGYNDLATTHPAIAAEWHPTKNGELTPQMVTAGSSKKVWWLLPYDDPKTGKHFDFEWEAYISNRSHGHKCPFLSGHKVFKGFNDLSTTHPGVAAEWHPTKNGKLIPENVTAASHKKVWWHLPYDDPKTGKHFNFEWKSSIDGRTRYDSSKCPFLVGKKVFKGFNDLGTLRPDIAAGWHPIKNGVLTPSDITVTSAKKVWWIYPYDDPVTGKHFDFEWEARVFNRIRGSNCPFLSGQKIFPGFNDLSTTHPDVAAEWHPTKNGKLTPKHLTRYSERKVWWMCPQGHEWLSAPSSRTRGHSCPVCRTSKGEKKISKFLDTRNIRFISEYTFDDCRYKNALRFDRAVFDFNGQLACLIEYDGEHHFNPVEFAGKGSGAQKLRITKCRDKIKNDYCRERRIPLVRISYKDYDNIERILLKKMIRYKLIA